MDAAAKEETIDSLRVHVRRGLDRFFLGQYFTEYGLAETAQLIPENDADETAFMDKHCNFQIFLKAVASEIVKEKGEVKGRKKRIKEYVEVLQAFQDEWVAFIKKNMRKRVKQAVTPAYEPQPTTAVSNDKNKDGIEKKKKGGKRGPRGPYKKRKKKEEIAPAPAPEPTPKRQKVFDLDQMRREFEEERDSILDQVPSYNKKMFNQVGWAKWSKSMLPAMILSPYSVPPGDIRDQWMKMFQNVKEKDRMNKMSHLVWWVGSKEVTYSVVAKQAFTPYEDGSKRGMHEIPKKVKKLLEQGKPLTKAQEEEYEGLKQLNELALLAPEDRQHPLGDFQEDDFWGYDEDELGASDDDLKDVEEEVEDDEDELVDSDVEESVKKNKGKYKKRKKNDIIIDEDEGEEVVYDDIEEVSAGPPKKRKKEKAQLDGERKQKKKKKRPEETDAMDADAPVDNELKDTEEVQFPPASPPAASAPAPETTKRLSLEEVLGDEASASGHSALEDSDYGGDVADEGDDLAKHAVAPTKSKMGKLKKKNSKRENGTVEGEKRSKKKKDKKDKEPKQPKKRTKAAEQRDLDRCVDEYLPLIDKLKAVKDEKNAPQIQTMLQTLLPVADKFTASFFSEYEIPKVMKSTKSVLEESGSDTSTYRKLWNKMKASYTEKAKLLPEGFKPRRRRSKASADDDDPAPKTVKEEPNASSQSSPSRDQDQAPVKIENDSLESSAARRVSETDNQAKSLVKQESKRRLSSTSDLSKGQDKSSVLPPKPKKFSVMDFMRKKKDPSRESISSVTGIDKIASPACRGTSEKKAIPSWVTAPPPSSFDSFAGSDRREDRLFALEFLLQAAAHFPAGKGVNEESVARGLEMAVYEWSEKQNSWSDSYWDKIHSVVAAITGKREVGSIVSMIMDGYFASPKAIVALSDENLEHSFEGRPFEVE